MRACVLLALVCLAACGPDRPEPDPAQVAAEALATRRTEGEAAIRARRAEFARQREKRAEKRQQRADEILQDAFETCRRNREGDPLRECERMVNDNPRNYSSTALVEALRSIETTPPRRR
ncbi:MAG TPA: hypothetical protein VF006_29700 [Longimicrobium sp.]